MDAAQQVDDDRAGGGLAGLLVLAAEPVGQQDAQAGAGVRLQHIHDGAAGLGGLPRADGAEDAVVDGVVEEEHLGRLDEDGHQGQQPVGDEDVHPGGQDGEDDRHQRADDVVPQHRQHQAQDAGREVVDQHLEAGGDVPLGPAVKGADGKAGQRAHRHGAHQHGVVGAADAAHHRDGGDDPAAVPGHHVAALARDQDGQQIVQHRVHDAGQVGVGQPARLDEEGGQKAPGDERADVGHDHAAEEFAKAADFFFHVWEDSFLSYTEPWGFRLGPSFVSLVPVYTQTGRDTSLCWGGFGTCGRCQRAAFCRFWLNTPRRLCASCTKSGPHAARLPQAWLQEQVPKKLSPRLEIRPPLCYTCIQ